MGIAVWSGSAQAGPFTGLVVFGDSLSDIGNIAQSPFINTPGPYYSNGRFSNGPVYAESLATGLGLPTLVRSTNGGNDFAYGGAKTTGTGFPDNLFVKDIDDQVSQFLASRTANASTLYLIFAGANDLIGGQTNMSAPINSLMGSINQLVTVRAALVGDTWQWDGADWTQLADTGPSPRAGHQVAFDRHRSRLVLFGGKGDGEALQGDTWEWDGEAWTQVADSGPDPRWGH